MVKKKMTGLRLPGGAALGIHPPVQGFEAPLAGTGRLKEERA